MRHTLFLATSFAFLGSLASTSLSAAETDAKLIEQGEYIARAADCMACHVGADGTPWAGGKPTVTPMGEIIAPNISSSTKYGIGKYSVEDLTNVLRNGKTPSGTHLYPAMPYPDYQGMTDDDIKALHAYLQSLPAVEKKPDTKTDLAFPFNMRFLMRFWDSQNLGKYQAPTGLDEQQARGQYIVDYLGHCGTCHTPRNSLMGSDYEHYLGGAQVGSWFAPNITSDEQAGIGSWSEQQLADYFKNGQMGYAAQAAGPMGEAVHYSLQYLSQADRLAMAAYLKTVPAIANEAQKQPILSASINEEVTALAPVVSPSTHYPKDQLKEHGLKSSDIKDPDSPAGLYEIYCASCHSKDGYGQPVSSYASLKGNTTLRSANPRNLVAVILEGVSFQGASPRPLMPGFADRLEHEQIAALANYLRTEFGEHANSDIDAEQVAYIASGEQKTSALFRYASLLAWLGIIVVIVAIAAGVWFWRRRRHQPSVTHRHDVNSTDKRIDS